MRTYTDEQLADAVSGSRSWRGVLRSLGLRATSGSAVRSVRQHADQLGLDHAHFAGQRTWTDQQLSDAIARATGWSQVAQLLGLGGGSSTSTLKGHALRLGIDTKHLGRHPEVVPPDRHTPVVSNLRRAGSLLAAAWFELCGYDVSWPLEPCPYDLIAWMGDGAQRVQVKTTTLRTGSSWTVKISPSGSPRTPYDPETVDAFFIIDGDLNQFLIPLQAVGGFKAIQLSAYQPYLLPRLSS